MVQRFGGLALSLVVWGFWVIGCGGERSDEPHPDAGQGGHSSVTSTGSSVSSSSGASGSGGAGCSLEVDWAHGFGDARIQTGLDVAVDKSGNVLFAGYAAGATDFGGGPMPDTGDQPKMYLVKLDRNGKHIFSKMFVDANTYDAFTFPLPIAVRDSGNVIVAGSFEGSIDFGGATLDSAGEHDAFVVELDPAGNHLWSKRFGDAARQFVSAVAVDASGAILLGGHNGGAINLGGGPIVSVGSEDMFFAKLDPNGGHLWSRSFGNMYSDGVGRIVDGGSGNVVVVGFFAGEIDLGGGPLSTISGPPNGVFLAKFDASGNHVWSKHIAQGADLSQISVAVDAGENILLAGGFTGTMDFGGGPLSTDPQNIDIFLVKLDSGGNHVWSSVHGGVGKQHATAIAVDSAGNAFVSGEFTENLLLGNVLTGDPYAEDIFVARVDAAGTPVWGRHYGDETIQYCGTVAVDPTGGVVIGGSFVGALDFGCGPIQELDAWDAFVAKLRP